MLVWVCMDTSLCLMSFYYCCRVRGKLSTKWLFRFASWRENIQMEITAFVTELELCNYFHSPCSQLIKSLSYIHSISAYHKAPTAQQLNNNKNLKRFTSFWHSIEKRTWNYCPHSFLRSLLKRWFSLNYWTADFGRIWDILNDLFIESE